MKHFEYLMTIALSVCLLVGVESMTSQSMAAGKKNSAQSKSKKTPRKVREKNIIREKTYRGAKKNIDFDAVDIAGERKNPFGSNLGQSKADKEFDLIKIRLRWHPEMIQSTSSLETGRR